MTWLVYIRPQTWQLLLLLPLPHLLLLLSFPFDPNHSLPQKWKCWFVLIRFISFLSSDNFDLFVSSNPNWNCQQVDVVWGWWGVRKLVRVKKSQNILYIVYILYCGWIYLCCDDCLLMLAFFFSVSFSWAPTNKMNCLRWLDEYIQWICQTCNKKTNGKDMDLPLFRTEIM